MTRLWSDGELVETWGPEEVPDGFIWQRESHRIDDVCNRWRVHTRWWEPGETIWREYLKVTTDTGLLCLLYRDHLRGGYFMARLYD